MALFVCERCSHIENTALGAWAGRIKLGLLVVCSLCEWGEWHGMFPRVRYDRSYHGAMRVDRILEDGTRL